MMLTHCGNNVRNRYSGCVFSVKDIVPVPLKTSRNHDFLSFRSAAFLVSKRDYWLSDSTRASSTHSPCLAERAAASVKS